VRPSLAHWLFIALLALPLADHAASFDCGKASTATEKAICADPVLSQQDDELARLWQDHAHAGDTVALQAQRAWIRQRNICGNNVACLKQSYAQRLVVLQQPVPWQQTWHMDQAGDSVGSELKISSTQPLHFSLSGWNGANTGALEGDAVQDGQTHASYDKEGCRLDFRLLGDTLQVEEKETTDGGCGAGMGVSYGGSYVTATRHAERKPSSLQSLGIVGTAAEDLALRKLLGKDYAALLDDVNMRDVESAAGTTITKLWVRGIANSNAAIVMNHNSRDFWVGLLVFGAHDQLRMRYYTNIAQDKHNVPKPIRDWHDQIDPQLPIDLMP